MAVSPERAGADAESPPVLLTEDELPKGSGLARLRLDQIYRAVAVVLVLVLAFAVVQATSALVRAGTARQRLIERVDPAILRHGDFGEALRDQEMAVRAYAATGAQADLARYRTAVRQEAAAITGLRDLLVDLPDSRPALEQLDRFSAATKAWRTGFADHVAADRPGNGTIDPVTEQQGQRLLADAWSTSSGLRAQIVTLHGKLAKDLSRRASDAYWSVGVALAAIVLAALALFVLFRRTVLRPLGSLSSSVRAVSQGDFDHPLRVTGSAEIVELATIIDAMRERILDEWRTSSEAMRLLDEQAAELRRSNAELEQFAYVASHDLQEPLRKVASFCQMIERRYGDQLDERGKQYIDFAVDGAKRMQALINDLLSFSRVGRMSRPEEAVDLRSVLDQALDNLSSLTEETGAQVTADELPTVAGDRTQLTQLFQNLVGNAMKFRREGEPPRVHIGVRRVGDEWEFSCSDNGIGIEPRHADRVFLIFQRLHPRDEYGGTGIGLALCKKIVEYHGGRIWLDGSAGETPTQEDAAPEGTAKEDAAQGGGGDAHEGTTIRWTIPAGEDDE